MNSHSIALHDFDIGFVKDFSKIIRIANYGFPSIVTRLLLHPQPQPAYGFSLNRNPLSASPAAMQPRLCFTINRLATSPSTCLLLHLQHACRFALNRKPSAGFTRNREPRLYFTVNQPAVSPASMSPACSFALNPLAPSPSTRLQLYM